MFRELRMFGFRILFSVILVHMSVIHIKYQPFQIVSLFLTGKKIGRVFIVRKNGSKKNYIKFCVKNEIKCAWTFEVLTVAFGESTMGRTQVHLWYNRFNEGREDVNDAARPGRPSTSTTDENIEAMK